jgi:hypothetical protein
VLRKAVITSELHAVYALSPHFRHGRDGAQHRSAVTAAIHGMDPVELEKVSCNDRFCIAHRQTGTLPWMAAFAAMTEETLVLL